MTSRLMLVPSSGMEAVMATKTALTLRRSARGRVRAADQQVHSHNSVLQYIMPIHVIHT